MNVELLGALVGNTVVLGSLYALVGIGFVILFRSTGVVNFAQGTFMVLAAYVFYTLVTAGAQPLRSALLITFVAISALGATVYLALFHRLIGAELFVTVIATMGLSIVLQMATFLIWGPQVRPLPALIPGGTLISLAGIPFSRLDLLSVGTSLALIASLELVMQRTVLGVRMRAVADSPLLAALSRVDVHRMSALAWAISALSSAVAGVAVALRVAVDPVSLGQLGLLIFPVVIIGGVDSIRGAMVGGLIVAVTQNLAVVFLGGNWVNPVAYAILLIVLLVRPRGLFGSQAIGRI